MLPIRSSPARASVLALLLHAACVWGDSQVNVTIDDTDAAIVYSPATSWNSSAVTCDGCNDPSPVLAVGRTFHKGANIAVGSLSAPAASPPTTSAAPASASPPAPAPAPATGTNSTVAPPQDTDVPGGTDNDGDYGGSGSGHGKGPRRRATPAPVSLRFPFTGVAVYAYAIEPSSAPTAASPSAQTNLTFNLDDLAPTTLIRTSGSGPTDFLFNASVFAQTGLADGDHVLTITLGDDSVFIIDYFVVTQSVVALAGSPSAASSSSIGPPLVTGAVSDASAQTKSGRASFVGVVAGVVGSLALLASSIALSLIIRRRNSQRRNRLHGPAPAPATDDEAAVFVPRYFPGEEPRPGLSPVLPPYEPRSYADVPPPLDQLPPLAPPPSTPDADAGDGAEPMMREVAPHVIARVVSTPSRTQSV
ncbi:unnamed protein product [Mycena citricolor]|uniref:Uncharacterized protein n=1 Tax=Mycena citricolor TaxID=2018698 RepID=A0AAD2HC77_9AGAR|nr:unnamed protein product [Mycena citricolor]